MHPSFQLRACHRRETCAKTVSERTLQQVIITVSSTLCIAALCACGCKAETAICLVLSIA